MPETKEEIMKKMDTAATEALAEFKTTWTAKQVSEWFAKWYTTAGYKRLSKILIIKFKQD